jgi:heme-degrading monooxygenase HmoA
MKRFVGLLTLLILSTCFVFTITVEPQQTDKMLIARIWHGKTRTEKADEYERYLRESGIKAITAIDGNKGIQLMRKTNGDLTEFMVISYWDSIDAIKKFAGEDYQKVRQAPRDPEFLVEPETLVQHYEVRLWKDRL